MLFLTVSLSRKLRYALPIFKRSSHYPSTREWPESGPGKHETIQEKPQALACYSLDV